MMFLFMMSSLGIIVGGGVAATGSWMGFMLVVVSVAGLIISVKDLE